MSFFEPRQPQPDMSVEQPTGWAPPLWDRPSEAIMGAPVAISALLARSDRVAVAVGHFAAYPNGFTFELIIQGNPMAPRPGGMMHPGSAMLRMGPPGVHRGPRLWSFPLPPPGTMKVFVDWEDLGIPETMVELDADLIRGAASRAVVLWDSPPATAGS